MIELALLLAPALVLLGALGLRRYPGERVIVRLRRSLAPRRRLRARARVPARGRPAPILPRGGRLVAACIAARPPPGG